MWQFGKYIVCNVLRLQEVATNQDQAFANIIKNFKLKTFPISDKSRASPFLETAVTSSTLF